MRFSHTSLILVLTSVSAALSAETPKVTVGEFGQEIAHQYTTIDGLPANETMQIVARESGAIFAETTQGWAKYENSRWSAVENADAPPSRESEFQRAEQMVQEYLAQTSEGAGGPLKINDVEFDRNLAVPVLVATNIGFFAQTAEQSFRRLVYSDDLGRTWGNRDVLAVGTGQGETGGGGFCTRGGVVNLADGKPHVRGATEGLPFNEFTSMSMGPDASWFGTTRGVIVFRYQNRQFSYRQGKRWLPDDHVTDILAMPDGSAWVATKGGVAHLTTKPMTFAAKAAVYEEDIEKYIKRTEYGYVAESFVEKPGDKSMIRHSDSDNDGLWTAMYGAGECFAYAASKDPKTKKRAAQTFEALRFLQKVTQGGEHSPPKGYVARTILPADGPDPNAGRIEGDREEQKSDALWKVYEPRWPKSADGKWYWKSDTSSDELDGHYFLYAAYYDLVAETEAEKERVREVVRDLTGHLVDHGFRLIDHDGKVTRWGDYSPESLNGDRRWYVERGLNSLSMLSYLAVAEHVTGDQKFADATKLLIEKHHYDQNAMAPKMHYGIGSGNQSDDEMAFMSFYNLIKYTKNDELRERMRHVFFNYWKLEFPEMNPFFNFTIAASCFGTTSTTHWGKVDLSPYDGWLEDSVGALKGFSLDRFNWGIKNSHRLDLVSLYRQQTIDIDDSEPPRRALRVNGKVLPVEERFFNHYNTDPYHLDYGGDGRMLASGTVFLLPYYMGLYYGYIE